MRVPSPGPERFSENKGGTGNLPVLAGYQPSRFRQHRTVSACDAPNSAASCRRTQPGWLCYPVQLNRYGTGEGEARTVPGIFTPFGVELLRGDLRQGYGIEAAFENVSCREARMPRHWAPGMPGLLPAPIDLVNRRLVGAFDDHFVDADVRRTTRSPNQRLGDVFGGERVDSLVNFLRPFGVAFETDDGKLGFGQAEIGRAHV